jgi:ArsR family transcriptional regulator, arsenate/arsenite/antimonite-responsive transcriptional repressor
VTPDPAVRRGLTGGSGRPTYISLFGETQISDMRAFMNITKALADENRVRTILALRKGELCVCQITELFGLAPSTVSKHLSILYQAELVESRKDGRWIYYRLPAKGAPPMVRRAIEWVTRSLEASPRIAGDAARLETILNMDPVELCKRQCQR